MNPPTEIVSPDERCFCGHEDTEFEFTESGLMLPPMRVQYICVVRANAPAVHRLVLGKAEHWGGEDMPSTFVEGFSANNLRNHWAAPMTVGKVQDSLERMRRYLTMHSIEDPNDAYEQTLQRAPWLQYQFDKAGLGGVEL